MHIRIMTLPLTEKRIVERKTIAVVQINQRIMKLMNPIITIVVIAVNSSGEFIVFPWPLCSLKMSCTRNNTKFAIILAFISVTQAILHANQIYSKQTLNCTQAEFICSTEKTEGFVTTTFS